MDKKRRAIIKKVVRQINKGGVTYDVLRNKDYSGTLNIAIAPLPERSEIFSGRATSKMLTNYYRKNNDLLQKGFPVGGWFNQNNTKTYLDITVPIPSEKRREAISLGKKANQIAGFDLYSFSEIPLGGTGEVNDSLVAPFEERLNEALALMGN